ncbi:hypothetical protein [Pasteuria penetrans]|nr:hypothetical protein [Pasteuria penetrans]
MQGSEGIFEDLVPGVQRLREGCIRDQIRIDAERKEHGTVQKTAEQ